MRCGGTQGGVGPPGGVSFPAMVLGLPSPLPPHSPPFFCTCLPYVCPQRWSWVSPSSTSFLGGRGPSLTILGSCC